MFCVLIVFNLPLMSLNKHPNANKYLIYFRFMLFRQIFAQKRNREGKYLVNETYTCGCKKAVCF